MLINNKLKSICGLMICLIGISQAHAKLNTSGQLEEQLKQQRIHAFESWLKKNGIQVAQANTSSTESPKNTDIKHAMTFNSQASLKKARKAMLNAAPPQLIPRSQSSNEAFQVMMQKNMPLTSEQIVKLHQLIDTAQRAAAIPAVTPPRPVSTTEVVNLAPGQSAPVIRLYPGYISTIVFLDGTGAPWPVKSIRNGNPKLVNVQWDNKTQSHIIALQRTGNNPYLPSNMVVQLEGLSTPITLELVSMQKVVDYRIDMHVPFKGPKAKAIPIHSGMPKHPSHMLMEVLDGIPPAGASRLMVIGGGAKAWVLGNTLYLRTRFTLLSPAWNASMSSADGMHAYEITISPPQLPTVLISKYGGPKTIQFSHEESE